MIGIKHITIPTALGIKQDQTYRPDFSIISQTVDIRLVSALIGSPNAWKRGFNQLELLSHWNDILLTGQSQFQQRQQAMGSLSQSIN